MSWMQRLYETFEQANMLDIPDEEKPMPICHTRQNAHINIVIDGNGCFKRAKVLFKQPVVLPATEQSAGRTGKCPPPHPLGDKLHYIAKDYKKFGGEKPSFFDEYCNLLESWCNSEFSHPKAKSVFDYVSKGRVVEDLVTHKILWLDNGKLITPENLDEAKKTTGTEPDIFKSISKDQSTHKYDQGSALICWSVEVDSEPLIETWLDIELQAKWINFYASQDGIKGLCFIMGETNVLAFNHPSKILQSESGAKLISANDFEGFTFRGKFVDTKKSAKENGLQGLGVGFDTTQKAHNALKWLLTRQGKENGKQAIIAWAVSGKLIPSPIEELNNWNLDDYSDDFKSQLPPNLETAIDFATDLGQRFGRALKSHMAGYFNGQISNLKNEENIIILVLDSATRGRKSISFYRDVMAKEYMQAIENWYSHFAWPQRSHRKSADTEKTSKSEINWLVSTPTPREVLEASYGDIIESNKELKKTIYERLLPSIIDGRSLPYDICQRAVIRASNRNIKRLPDKYSTPSSEYAAWEKDLGVACALYRGFHHPDRQPDSNKRRHFAMSLDLKNTSRDYLYGRLLAVAENIEELALCVAKVNRSTTAARLMQRFSDRPFSTWKTINDQLQPYVQQLTVSRRGFIENRKKDLDGIMDLFQGYDFTNDKALTGEYLLGFHCQRMALRNKKNDSNEKNNANLNAEERD